MFFVVMLATARSSRLAKPNAKQNIGVDTRTLWDSTGKAFGAEFYAASQKPEGEITRSATCFLGLALTRRRLGRSAFATRVSDDLGCGVGYYK